MTETGVNRNAAMDLANEVQALESKAHDLGLTLAGHALNRAKNVVGWLAADDLNAAMQALNGDHPK